MIAPPLAIAAVLRSTARDVLIADKLILFPGRPQKMQESLSSFAFSPILLPPHSLTLSFFLIFLSAVELPPREFIHEALSPLRLFVHRTRRAFAQLQRGRRPGRQVIGTHAVWTTPGNLPLPSRSAGSRQNSLLGEEQRARLTGSSQTDSIRRRFSDNAALLTCTLILSEIASTSSTRLSAENRGYRASVRKHA